jgi:hypothetical protein
VLAFLGCVGARFGTVQGPSVIYPSLGKAAVSLVL